jgi:hypothetical protein
VNSKFVELGDKDKKARDHILESLSVCAHDHILSRKLLSRFLTASGPMYAIIGDWFELSEMTAYDYTILPPDAAAHYAHGDFPQDRQLHSSETTCERLRTALLCARIGGRNAGT